MPKQYRITWNIDDKLAQAAIKRGVDGLTKIDAAALRSAKAMEAALASVGKTASGSATAQVNGLHAVTAAANGSAAAQVNGINRVVKAAGEGSAKRKKAATDETQHIDVGLYKVAVNGIKYQDSLTKAAEKSAAQRQRIFDKAVANAMKQQGKEIEATKKAEAAKDAERQKFFDKAAKDEHDREIQQAKSADRLAAIARRKEQVEAGPMHRVAALRRKNLTEEQAIAAAQNKLIDVNNKKRVDAIMGTKDSFAEAIAQGTGFNNLLTTVGITMVGLEAGRKIIGGVAEALEMARKNSSAMAKDLLTSMAAMRALASVTGGTADAKSAVELAGFAVDTGMSQEQSRNFLENFHGRAQITKGRNISGAEYDKFAKTAGQITAAKNIPADVAGDLLASTLKVENFQAKGQGSKEAAARAAAAIKILDAGSGRMPVLAPELNKVVASLTSEGKLEGVFRNIGEAAVATSVAAEHNPAEAGTMVERTSMGLRDFQDKDKKPFFKRAGITEADSFLEAIGKANRVIGEEVAKGVPVDTAIDKFGFSEIREKRGLRTFFNARNTVLKPQMENLEKATGPGAADALQKDLTAFQKSEVGQDLVGKAKVEQAKTIEGVNKTSFQIAKQKAEANLIREGIDTTVLGTGTQYVTGRDTIIEARALSVERNRARRALSRAGATPREVDRQVPVPGGFGAFTEAKFGQNADLFNTLKRIADTNEELVKQGRKVNAGPGRPAPLPGAPAVNKRP